VIHMYRMFVSLKKKH